MKKLLLLFVGIAFTFTAKAQTEDKKWNVGLHTGVTQYSGDLGRDWYETDNSMYGFGGLSVSRNLGKLFDVSVLLSKGTLGYHNGTTHICCHHRHSYYSNQPMQMANRLPIAWHT